MVCTLVALGASQFLVGAFDVASPDLFLLGGMIYAASIIPVMLTRISAPEVEPTPPLSVAAVIRHSPFGVITSLGSGIVLGGYWALGPVFAVRQGFGATEASSLMAASIFCGLLLQWPAARLSDAIDRRVVVLGLTTAAAIASAAMLFPVLRSPGALFVCFGLVGSVFCLYPLAVAHAIDYADGSVNTLQISRGLLLANGLGLSIGPVPGGPVRGRSGHIRVDAVFCLGSGNHGDRYRSPHTSPASSGGGP